MLLSLLPCHNPPGLFASITSPLPQSTRPTRFCISSTATIYPAYFVYYYSLTLTGQKPCVNDSDRGQYLDSFEVNTDKGITKRNCQTELNVNCYWVYDLRCVRKVWMMDVWLRMPFSLDMLDQFDDWHLKYEEYTREESLTMFKLGGFQGRTVINRHGFYIECPRGTRIERDFVCRGCSKGYYMSQQLLECLPCPPLHFQDTNYAHTCKLCPAGGSKTLTGLTKLVDCFHFSYWEEDSSIERIIGGLACVVVFSAVMLFYRSHVRNEPDGRHREVYVEPTIKAYAGGRLQRLMRVLQPMYMYPSQFDNMTVSAQKGTETTRFISKTGKSKIVSQREKRSESESSTSSSSSSEETSSSS
ncbi:hypothetical protein BsWGS_24564 [Bradybaena similaris]